MPTKHISRIKIRGIIISTLKETLMSFIPAIKQVKLIIKKV